MRTVSFWLYVMQNRSSPAEEVAFILTETVYLIGNPFSISRELEKVKLFTYS